MNRLLFQNGIGKIYHDKIVINGKKTFFYEIRKIEITKKINRKINFTLACMCVPFLYRGLSADRLEYTYLLPGIIIFILAIFIKLTHYLIVINIKDRRESRGMGLKSAERKAAEEFIREVNIQMETKVNDSTTLKKENYKFK